MTLLIQEDLSVTQDMLPNTFAEIHRRLEMLSSRNAVQKPHKSKFTGVNRASIKSPTQCWVRFGYLRLSFRQDSNIRVVLYVV